MRQGLSELPRDRLPLTDERAAEVRGRVARKPDDAIRAFIDGERGVWPAMSVRTQPGETEFTQ